MTNLELTKEIQMTSEQDMRHRHEVVPLFGVRHSFGIRHSALVILGRFTLIVMLALILSCSSKRITKANVDQVAEGMSKKQVESILGPPTSRTTDLYVYRQGKDTVSIVFQGDKVQSKKSTLSD
jgi:hypothetical protein